MSSPFLSIDEYETVCKYVCMVDKTTKNFPITPRPGYIIVTPKEQEQNQQFIVATDEKERNDTGTVVAVGEKIPYEQSPEFMQHPPCSVGDIIIFRKWGTTEYKMPDGKTVRFVAFKDVLGTAHEPRTSNGN